MTAWNSFYQDIDVLKQCSDMNAIQHTSALFLRSLNIHYFHYSWKPSPIITDVATVSLNHVEKQWVEYCDKFDLASIQHSPFTQKPMEWMISPDQQEKGKRNRIIGGCIIPIRGVAGSNAKLYVYYRKTTHMQSKTLPLLENWAIHLQNQVEVIHANMYLQAPMTSREKEILTLTSIGKTASEISKIINVEPTTVNFHLTNLRKKFDAYNKQHLIAKAVALNFEIISPHFAAPSKH